MEQLKKIIVSIATKIAAEEGITDENQFFLRVNEISEDAIKEIPETEIGKKVKLVAEDQGIASPYVAQPTFDMNALYDKTANASIKSIFEVIAKYACPELGRPMVKATSESDAALLKINNDMSLEVFKILNDNKVPLVWIANVMQDLKAIIGDLDAIMKKQVVGHTKEILSRTIGIRHPSPENNGFNDGFATYEDLLKTREVVFQQTGGKIEDYKQDFTDIG